MRILVVQTAFMGDCVLTLPFLHRLAELHPDAFVDVVATEPGATLFEIAARRGLAPLAPRLRVWRFDKRGRHAGFRDGLRFAHEIRDSRSEPIELAYCLQRSLRSGFLAWATCAQERVGFSTGSVPFFYTKLVRREWDTGKSEIEKNLDLLRAIHPQTPIAPWSPKNAPALLRNPNLVAPAKKPVLLSLGSPWATKRWPVENAIPFVEELTREGYELRLLGDKSAEPLGRVLKERVPSLLLKDLSGQTGIEQWIDEIQQGHLLVSGDSAAVHVASDLNVPVIALFGPTLPEFGFAPWRRGSSVLGVSNLDCRPCHIHGPKICPLGHHRCLKDLQGTEVLSESRRFLEIAP